MALLSALSAILSGCISSSGGCLQDGRTIQVTTNDVVSTSYLETGEHSAEIRVGESNVVVSAHTITLENRVFPLDNGVKVINIERSNGLITIYGDGQVLVMQQ